MGLYSIRNENDDIARCAHVHEFADPPCTESPLALASVGVVACRIGPPWGRSSGVEKPYTATGLNAPGKVKSLYL